LVIRNLHKAVKASSCSSLHTGTNLTPPSVTPASATAPARRYLAGLHDHGSATKKLDCVCKPRAERSGIFGASAKCGASMSEHELIPPPRVCASTITTGTQSRRRGTYDTVRDGEVFLHRRSSIYVSTHANPRFQTQLQLWVMRDVDTQSSARAGDADTKCGERIDK
jgi:hypothetical protein